MTLESFLEQFSGLIRFLLTAGAVWIGLGLFVALAAVGFFVYSFFVMMPREQKRFDESLSEHRKRTARVEKTFRDRH